MNKKVVSNLIWRFAERCGAQGVSFIVSMVLARLLMPEDYGTAALVMVFITILSVFVDSGLGNALIQKKDADDLDFSSVFYANLVLCGLVYALLFAAAPFIAAYYNRLDIAAPIRVMSLVVVISGVKNVQQAYVSKHLLFKRFFYATLGGTLAAAVLGIWMACHGFGVWAIIAQNLLNNLIDTVILWFTVPWHPKWMFSFDRLKGLFRYGWKLLASGLLDTAFNNLRSLVIGKLYSTADLAYYNKGEHIPNLAITNINTSIDSVLLPTMSNVQDDRERLKQMVHKSITVSCYVLAPIMMGLAATANSSVALLYSEKWLPCVPFMRIYCLTYMFWPIHTANLNAIRALGRSDIFLKLEIVKKAVGLSLLLLTMRHGVMAMAYSLIVSSVLGQMINSWPNKKLLNYPYHEQLGDILPAILLAAAMGLAVYTVEFLGLGIIPTLLIQVPLGAAIYIAGSAVLKLEAFEYLRETAKPLLRKFLKKKV